MRKVIASEMITLDGFFAGPEGDLSWHLVDDDYRRLAVHLLSSATLLVFGRMMYELMGGFWPTEAAAQGHLLVDQEQFTLSRHLPLGLLPPDAPPLVPSPLPDMLLPEPEAIQPAVPLQAAKLLPGPTFDASTLPERQREQFHRNLRAVEKVLAGATQSSVTNNQKEFFA
jgi:hypothetical protein